METWKPIPGHEKYEASDRGRIRSVDREVVQTSKWGKPMRRRLRGKILAPGRHPDGHLIVNLSPAGSKAVHLLVLLTFVGRPPAGREACHYDGDPANNWLSNLRYDTHKNNEADKLRHGTLPRGERQGAARLTRKEVRKIRASKLMGVTLAALYGISPTHVCNIRLGKAWSWL